MNLSEIITQIQGVAEDSRKVKKDYAFVAIKGFGAINGEDFIPQACKNGANFIFSENLNVEIPENVTYHHVENARKFLSLLNAEFSKGKIPERICAITGTNGKTSIAHICNEFSRLLEVKSASIGTVGVILSNGEKLFNHNLTTPSNSDLHEILRDLKNRKITEIFMEASSLGIDQERISHLPVKVAIFTNFTQDHLDYHGTMKSYFACKARLFSEILEENGTAIVNLDSENADKILEICKKRNVKLLTYGRQGDLSLISNHHADLKHHFTFKWENRVFACETKLIGDFQAHNLLASMAVMISLGHEIEEIVKLVPKINPVPGRMQNVPGTSIFIDYAHTEDAILKALQSLRKICKERLIILFGCGGQRDRNKRPKMCLVSVKEADLVFVTSDNPRNENPADIIAEIVAPCLGHPKLQVIEDRKMAIEEAISQMREGDVLLIAGKGHEKTQLISGQIFEFDEEKIVKNYLQK